VWGGERREERRDGGTQRRQWGQVGGGTSNETEASEGRCVRIEEGGRGSGGGGDRGGDRGGAIGKEEEDAEAEEKVRVLASAWRRSADLCVGSALLAVVGGEGRLCVRCVSCVRERL